MKTSFLSLLVDEPNPNVFVVTSNRPEVRNALNTQMAKELREVFSSLADNPKLEAVILTGAEEKAFCAGADLKERDGMEMSAWKAQHAHFEAMIEAIVGLKSPVIASVNGVAFGGGLEIILACDFALAVGGSKFSFSEAKLGIIPGLGGIYRLTKLVGPAKAKELVCTAKVFSSEEAKELGIFSQLVSAKDLTKETLGVAEQISACSREAVLAAKEAVELSDSTNIEDWTKGEHRLYYSLVESEERRERIRAFNKK